MSGESPNPSPRDRLPFEPGKRRKAKANPEPEPSSPAPTRKLNPLPPSPAKASKAADEPAPKRVYTRSEMAIPDAVSKRMAKRMVVFCGVPTVLSFSSFIGAYFVNTRTELSLPNSLVFSASLGFLVLGVLGLSYGVLSSSWDETATGSLLGVDEFRTNFGRMVKGWQAARSARNKQKS